MLDDEQKLLIAIQEKLNRIIVFHDLYHLPEVVNLFIRFCQINDIDKRNLKCLYDLYRKYGPFCICANSGIIKTKVPSYEKKHKRRGKQVHS